MATATKSMSYISKLRDQNAHIQELTKNINSYICNKKLYDSMQCEYDEKTTKLEALKKIWENEYVPALEMRQVLRSDLYTAEHQRYIFERKMKHEMQDLSVYDLERQILQFNDEIRELNADQGTSVAPSLESSSTCAQSKVTETDFISPSYTASSVGQYVTNLEVIDPVVEEVKKVSQEKKVGHAWTLSRAEKMVHLLEEEYESTKTKRRSLGSRTCALSVELKALDLELARMESSMYISPDLLYRDLKSSLNWWKLKYFMEELKYRKGIAAPALPQQQPMPLFSVLGNNSSASLKYK